jgi:DNA helicase-2/ATP-dependent DNA helicase PcrA
MSFCQTRMLHGQTRYNMKSRFFDELPEESLKWLSPRVQPQWFSRKSAWDEMPAVPTADNALAARINQKAGGSGGWRIGESVSHAKFGEGVIINIEGSGSNCRAQINFGAVGIKVLDLSVAKLERL